MGIGAGIVLVAIGAVLRFAVKVTSSHGFNIHTVGIILMAAGVVGVLLDLILFMPRRRRSVTTTVAHPTYDDRTVVRRDDIV